MIVVAIEAMKKHYFLSKSGRWTADLKRAKVFSTAEDAKQEATRRGTVKFLGETCQARVIRVEEF